jgi:hypothetical protein
MALPSTMRALRKLKSGSGAIGLLCTQIARAKGAKTIIVAGTGMDADNRFALQKIRDLCLSILKTSICSLPLMLTPAG